MIIAAAKGGREFGRFVTFRIEGGSVKERQEVIVMPGGADALARQLVGLEVDVLLASAIHPAVDQLELHPGYSQEAAVDCWVYYMMCCLRSRHIC